VPPRFVDFPEILFRFLGIGKHSHCLKVAMPGVVVAGCFLGLSGVPFCEAQNIAAPAIRLDFRVISKGKPLQLRPDGISRFDFLLSELSLQRKTGEWFPGDEWFAYVSAGEGRLNADTTGSPAGEFKALRFRVGLDEKTDMGDPAQWAPDHPLNPDLNHLHWSWQGGYIHLAIEGISERGPFSYHLAHSEDAMIAEVPVSFRAGGPVTLSIDIDADEILSATSGPAAANSTHSRPGDELAAAMKANVRHAFHATGVSYDLFQKARPDPATTTPPPEGTHAYPARITRRFPQVTLPADNPLTIEGVALGRRLFFDPILSVNGSQSCSTCHQPAFAFADPRRVSLGAHGQPGKRNAMTLANLAWAREGLFWDGRAKSIREQVLVPMTDPAEMGESIEHVLAKLNADATYPAEFKKAYTDGISAVTLAKSLEQYVLTLVSQESNFDRAVRKRGELTEEEKQGLSLFVTEHDPARGLRGADCFHCHGGTLFTDNRFHNNGIELDAADTGLMAITGNAADRGKFKTPSLRNIALTAPYMHDGRFATLEEVVDHYDRGVKRTETLDPNLGKHPAAGLGMTDSEKKALVAFLKTLTDEEFTASSAQVPVTGTVASPPSDHSP
jgi:cytochrome c peroxidase